MWNSRVTSSIYVAIVAVLGGSACGLFDPETGGKKCVVPELCGPDATAENAIATCAAALQDPDGFSADVVQACQERAEDCEAAAAPPQWCAIPDAGSTAGTSGTAGAAGAAARSAGMDGGAGQGGTAGGSSSACTECDDGQVCDEESGQCVQCLQHTDCEAPNSVCTDDHRCVRCTEDEHCQSSAPACDTNTNTCVGCTDSARHCDGDTPLCDLDLHECVQCLQNSDCTDPAASLCSDGTCSPCTGPLHCEHLDDFGVCDTSSGSGECVECTGTRFAGCGMSPGGDPYACDSLTRTCTQEVVGSALACQPCVSDAHCAAGMACMQTKFGSSDTGNFCLWKESATGASAPNGDCLSTRPYVGTESGWTSVDGEAPIVCKPRTSTCQAQNDFSGKSCTGETPDGHAQCGAAGVDDANCAPFGASQHFCTVPCVSHLDCKETRPGDDMECQAQMLGGQTLNVCQFQ